MILTEIKVPDIGDFQDVEVIEIICKIGDKVVAEDPLISVESDKATMEVPSPTAGVVRKIKIKVGDKVSEGSLILEMEKNEISTNKDNKRTNEKADSTENSTSPAPQNETPDTYSRNADIFCDVWCSVPVQGVTLQHFVLLILGRKLLWLNVTSVSVECV